ncbi:hypothetical protein [Parahaliea mediterranea]|uniref:hypothetical protein n=1 Tax=Parahaliea mediterranea TaxID=651086 RepID=UPI000E2F22F4|nr:hypothetical protein [Parahaliea mediterranea]
MDEQWKQTIVSGNKAYAQQDHLNAERHYLQACEQAEQLLLAWRDVECATAAVAVSYQNLADLYFTQSRINAGITAYRRLQDLLLDFRHGRGRSLEARRAAECAIRRLGAEILYKLKRLGQLSSASRQRLEALAQKTQLATSHHEEVTCH